MALNDFLIGLQFRFGTDSKSTQAVGNIKKGLSDITQALDNMNKIDAFNGISLGAKNALGQLNEFTSAIGSLKTENYTPFSNITDGLKENFEEAKAGMSNLKSSFYNLDEATRGSFGINDFLTKLREGDEKAEKLAENLSQKMGVSVEDIISKVDNWKSSLNDVKNLNTDVMKDFRDKVVKDFFPGESFDRLDKLDQTLVKAKGFEMMKQSIESTDKALSSMIGNAVLTKEAAAEIGPQMQEAFSKMRVELSETNFEKVSNALSGIDLSNLKPGQVIKVRKEMSQFNKLVQDGATSQALASQAAQIQRMVERSNALKQSWQNFTNTIRALVSGPLGSLTQAIGFYAILTDATQAQEQAMKDITRLNLENAQSIGEARSALRDYQSAMLDVGEAVDVSLVRAQEQMQALAQQRLSQSVDELARLAETSIQAQYALGISADAAAGLAKDIMLIGGASEEGFRDAANEIAVVQDQMGLTSQGATEVASTVGVIIRQMNALGGSADNVAVVTREVAKMTSAFEQAGMSAGDASQMLNELMDPQKLSDNTLLFHSMGMSAQEALAMMSGEGQNMEGMTENMVNVAKRLKDQYGGNIYALQSMAEAHGMSLARVQQLSSLSADQLQTRQDEAALEEQAAEARASMNEQMAKFGAQLNILMQRVVLPLVGFFTRILEVINGMVTGTENFLNRLGVVGDAVKVVIGALLIGLLATKMTILKGLLPAAGRFISSLAAKGPLKMLSDGLKGIGSQVGTLANTVKDKLTGAFSSAAESGSERLRDSITNITPTNQQRPRAPLVDQRGTGAAGAVSAAPDRESVGAVDKLGNSLEKIDTRKIMQIGAALFLVAGAVALLAFSYKMLVDTVKDASPGELAGAFIILIGIMGALAGMAFVLGKVSQTAGPQIMVLGAALLMVAGAASLLIVSMTLLLETIKSMTGGEIIAGIIMFAVVMGGLISVLMIMASLGPVIAAGLVPLGAAIMLVALSAVVMATAFLIMSLAMERFLGAIANMAGNVLTMLGVFTVLTIGLTALAAVAVFASLPLMALGVAITILGVGMALLALSINTVSQGLSSLASGLGEVALAASNISFLSLAAGLLVLGGAAMISMIPLMALGFGMIMLGIGMTLVAQSVDIVSQGLITLGDSIGQVNFSQLAGGLFILAGAAAIAIVPLMALGFSMMVLGVGLTLVGQSVELASQGLSKLAEETENLDFSQLANNLFILANAAVFSIIPLTLLGVSMLILGTGMLILGVGMTLVAQSINVVSEGLMTLSETVNSINFLDLAGNLLILAGAALFSIVPLMALGFSMMMLGVGMNLVSQSINVVSEGLVTLGEAVSEINFLRLAGGLLVLAGAAMVSSVPLMTLGIGMMMLGMGMTLVAQSVDVVAQGLVTLGEAVSEINFLRLAGGLLALAGAAMISSVPLTVLGFGMMMLGTGMSLVADNVMLVANGLTVLSETMGQIDWGAINKGILSLGLVSLVAAPGLMVLGSTMRWLGVGLKLAAENINIVADGLKAFTEQLQNTPSPDDVGLGEISNQILKFGLFALFAAPGITALGNAFMNMGQGISDINDKTAGAVEQLKALKEFLTSDDLAGLSQNFNSEIDKINNNLSSLSGGGIAQAQARLEQNVVQQASVDNRQEAPDQEAVVDQLAEANSYLSNISNKIDDIARSMTSGSGGGNRTRNDSTQVQVS